MIQSPFTRLATLLGASEPGRAPIALSVGEPQHAVPAFVGPILQANVATFSKYPMVWGTPEFRGAVGAWLARRYPGVAVDSGREVMVLSGSREGLFSATLAAASYPRLAGRRRVLMPNPFYPPYVASAGAAGLEPVLVDATAATGFLPDFESLPPAVLDDTVAAFLCSPANPQGAIAGRETLAGAIALARRHGFLLFIDECYSEIWSERAPPGGLEVAAGMGAGFGGIVVFNSLSKRSNLAGLRVGFVAGDASFLAHLADFRNVTCPQVPLALQAVAVAAYGDETHVDDSRALYQAKFADAARILGNRFGRVVPEGGFFLWLDVSSHGDDETIARRLWTEAGLRVVPGRYLAAPAADGSNPGAGYLRIALVHERATTAEALERLVATLA